MVLSWSKFFLINSFFLYLNISNCLTVQVMNAKFVQKMNKRNKNSNGKQEDLNILRMIFKDPDVTQRKMANELGLSLGKLNYCLTKLKEKGIIKINNFKKNPYKYRYIYLLTPKGISLKTKLTLNFMKRKMKEYDELKKELKEQSKRINAKKKIN